MAKPIINKEIVKRHEQEKMRDEFIDKLLERVLDVREKESKQDVIRQFFGCKEDKLYDLEKTLGYPKHILYSYFLEEVMQDYEIESIKSFGFSRAHPPKYHEIMIANDEKVSRLQKADILMRRDGIPYWIEVQFQLSNTCDPYIIVTTREEDKEYASLFIKVLEEKVKEGNFFKGQVLDFSNFEFLEVNSVGWEDIVLPEYILTEIKDNTVDFIKDLEVYSKFGLPTKRGLILYGPPGNGKTLVIRILSSILRGVTVLWATSKGLDQSRKIAMLYEAAKEMSPTLVIIEDIDLISKYYGVYEELLNQMDGLRDSGQIVTIATTNDLGSLSDALKNRPSRFDRALEIKEPDEEGRTKLLTLLTGNIVHQDVDFAMIVKETAGYSGAHMQELVITALRNAIKRDKDNPIVVHDDFLLAVEKVNYRKNSVIGF